MEKVCPVCFNAYVYNQLPESEDDWYDNGLDDSNDGGSRTVGLSRDNFQIYINSGFGKSLEIETCQWISDPKGPPHNGRWHTVAVYYPKFCPECGRELSEYKVDEHGSSFERR